MIFQATGRPGASPGRLFLCPARDGVLMAFCGLCCLAILGYLRQYNTLCAAFWRGLRRRCGVERLRGVWLPRIPRTGRAAWALLGPVDTTAPQIVLTGPAMLRGRGPNPGRGSVRRLAHGVE